MRIPVDLLSMGLFKQIVYVCRAFFGCGPIPTNLVEVLLKDGGGVLSHAGQEMERSAVKVDSIEESSALVPNA